MSAAAESFPPERRPWTPAGIAAAVACGLLSIAAALFAFANAAEDDRVVSALAHGVGVALPVGLGLWLLRREPADRLARVLIGAGLLFSLTALAESGDATLYSLGRVAAWAFEPVLAYLILVLPYGRLTTRLERRLLLAVTLVAVLLYLPSALLVQSFPEPSAWSTCDTACPPNALALTSGTPAFIDGVLIPVRETLTILLFGAIAFVIVARTVRAGPLMRRTLWPVAGITVIRAVSMLVYLVLRALDQWGPGLELIGFLYLFSLPALTLCFLAGLVNQRLFVADALQRLTVGLQPHATAPALRTALADALRDPSLEIVYWVGGPSGRWVDERGWPVVPDAGRGRWITVVEGERRRLAAIVHDEELSQDPSLIRTATTYALTALENERLIAQLSSSLHELSESRARIVAVADEERRRIERDLHDGAQQRLVALQIKLELIADRLDGSSPADAGKVRALEAEVEGVIDEVRSFARGVYPSLLVDRGLSEALRAAGRNAPLPAVVDASRIRRYRPEIEATVYFACMEALQNAAKHADGAREVSITLNDTRGLRFEVGDDGAGFSPADTSDGAGLTNIRDRLAAVDGALQVESAPGAGTRIIGVIPTATPLAGNGDAPGGFATVGAQAGARRP